MFDLFRYCGWLLAAGYWRLATGGWQLAAGYWRLATRGWLLAAGNWRLATGSWLLAAGNWRLATGSCQQLLSPLIVLFLLIGEIARFYISHIISHRTFDLRSKIEITS